MKEASLNCLNGDYGCMGGDCSCIELVPWEQLILIICGFRDGSLTVHRWNEATVLHQSALEGWIVCIAVGDALNLGQAPHDTVCVLSAEGYCTVFYTVGLSRKKHSKAETSSPPGSARQSSEVAFSQRLQANIATAMIVDIDGDGKEELVVGLTDGIVRTYRYHCPPTRNDCNASPHFCALSKWELPVLTTCLSVFRESRLLTGGESLGKTTVNLLISQPNFRYIILNLHPRSSATSDDGIQVFDALGEMSEDCREPLILHQDALHVGMFHVATDSLIFLQSNNHLMSQKLPACVFRIKTATVPHLMLAADWMGNVYSLNLNNPIANNEMIKLSFDAPIHELAVTAVGEQLYLAVYTLENELLTASVDVKRLLC